MTWLAQKLSSRRRVLLTGALYGCAAIFLLSVVLGGQESNDEKPDDSGVTVKGNGNALINGNSNQINYNAVIPQATASPTVNGCVGMLFAGKMVGNDISDNTVTNCATGYSFDTTEMSNNHIYRNKTIQTAPSPVKSK